MPFKLNKCVIIEIICIYKILWVGYIIYIKNDFVFCDSIIGFETLFWNKTGTFILYIVRGLSHIIVQIIPQAPFSDQGEI